MTSVSVAWVFGVASSTQLLVSAGILVALAAGVVMAMRAHRNPAPAPIPYSAGGSVRGPAPRNRPPEIEVDSHQSRLLAFLEVLLLVLLGGYLFFDQGFAWLHIPNTVLFISEIVILIGAVALLATNVTFLRAFRAAASLRVLALFMLWGLILLVPAIPQWTTDAVRDSVLWIYGAVALLVVALLSSDPSRFNRWLRYFGLAVPVFLLWFPFAMVLDVFDGAPVVPDSGVSIFAHKPGNMLVFTIIALAFVWLVDSDRVLFTVPQRNAITALAAADLLLLATRNRGGFVAAIVGLGIVLFFLGKSRSTVAWILAAVAVGLVTFGLLTNVSFSSFNGRDVSVKQLITNTISIFDRNAGGARQESTVSWRITVWGRVLGDVARENPVGGFGPGPDIGDRYGIADEGPSPLRNPHNSHVGIVARMGFLGTALWALLWFVTFFELLSLRTRLLRAQREKAATVVVWLITALAAILVNAAFDPTLEGPQVGFWLWAFFGVATAMIALERWGTLLPIDLARKTAARPKAIAPSR